MYEEIQGTKPKPSGAPSPKASTMPVRSQTFTQRVSSGGTTPTAVQIQQLESITKRRIIGLMVRYADSAGNRRSSNGGSLIPVATAQRSFLKIEKGADLKVDSLPIEALSFDRFNANGFGYYPIDIELANPKVTLYINSWAVAPTTDIDFEITIYYVD
jgi:hypothetical protein